jgi:hypothetical protein
MCLSLLLSGPLLRIFLYAFISFAAVLCATGFLAKVIHFVTCSLGCRECACLTRDLSSRGTRISRVGVTNYRSTGRDAGIRTQGDMKSLCHS